MSRPAARPARTAVVITGYITLQDMPDLPGSELCEYLANTPAPIDFGRTTLTFLESENTPVPKFDGRKFAEAIFRDVDPYMRAGNFRGLNGQRVAVIIIASYDPATHTSSMLVFGVDIDAGGTFHLQPLPVAASTTLAGTSFSLGSGRAVLPFGEVPYFNSHVLAGTGKEFLSENYFELLQKTKVSEVNPELASAVALNLIDAASKTAETITPPSGIGGGASAVLLGNETVILK
jgi:hypothetical protein